jgi:ubiquinone/menaquinone biosynthesis C-methylase UbiE
MNEKELYEVQYGQKRLISINSFPLLRKIFGKFDLYREDLVLSFLNEGDKLLDIGCGNGSFACKVSKKFNEVYGIDISSSRIQEARKRTAEKSGNFNNLYFSVCNVNEKIDFPNDMFDAAISIATIEHIFDPYFVIREVHRVLKKKGVFIAEVPNIAYLRHRVSLLFGKLPITSTPYNWKEIGWDGGHLHYFTKKTFCDLLKSCGFKILEVSGSGLFARLRNFYPSLLTGDICVKAEKC